MDSVTETRQRSRNGRRTIGIVAAAAFVVGFALLYLQSHNAKNRLETARDSVKANAVRYLAAVGSTLQKGPVTGARLLELREPVYRDGGGLRQGVLDVGATNVPVGVTISFKVRVRFKGSFNSAADTESCFRQTIRHGTTSPLVVPKTIDCVNLIPPVAPTAVLALP